jgi:predicted nucleotidyltransferase
VTRKQLEKKISKVTVELRERFSVDGLYVFGSVARDQATASSDVDIIVDFNASDIGLFEFLDLKIFLESVLGTKVDLVTRDALQPSMKRAIETEAVRVA